MIALWLFALHLTALPAEQWACEGQDGDRVRDGKVLLPYEMKLRAGADHLAVLEVEERGEPLRLLIGESGAPPQLLDLPPDGRALEVVVVERAGAVDVRLEANGGAPEAPVRLRLSCDVSADAPELAALRALQSASALLARAESDAKQGEDLRTRASNHFQVVVGETASAKWPWPRAAALHGSAFLQGRRNKPRDAAVQYSEAAKAWLDLGDPRRSAWALLREAQQWRRVSQFNLSLSVIERA